MKIITIPEDPGNPYLITNSVSVRSDDLGEPLRAVLWLNYNTQTPFDLSSHSVRAGTFDKPREIRITWNAAAAVSPGCHQLTLVVTHDDNLDAGRPEDDNDVAIATWWLNVKNADGTSASMDDCPVPGGAEQ